MFLLTICPIWGVKLYDMHEKRGLSKFLYFSLPSGKEVLLIGGQERMVHKQMMHMFYQMKGQKLLPKAVQDELWESQYAPSGAGICTSSHVTSWRSEGFDITTSEELRQKIADALGVTP